MSLELYKRYEIVFLAKNKYGPHYSINRIAELVNCNRTTVIRWLKRWDKTTNLSDWKRTGKPRKTTAEQDEIIINVVRQDVYEGLTSQRIQEQIKGDGIVVTLRTIRRRLYALVLNIRNLSQKVFLLNIMKQNVQYGSNHLEIIIGTRRWQQMKRCFLFMTLNVLIGNIHLNAKFVE